ncbi:MAG: hypothetical protein PHD83_03555 [Caldisericia bacterium]|nr:hypothetical protein [Caldisericia bacterium]
MRIAYVIVEDFPLLGEFLFPYQIPDDFTEEIQFGSILLVPFGLHNQPRLGFVAGFGQEAPTETEIKPIHQVVIPTTISKAQFRTIQAFAIFHQVPISKLLSWSGLYPKKAQPDLYYIPTIDSEDSLIGFRNTKALFRYLSKHQEKIHPVLFRKRFRLTKNTTILKKLESRGLLTRLYSSEPVVFQIRESCIPDPKTWVLNGLTQKERVKVYIQYIQTEHLNQVLIVSPNQVTQREIRNQINHAVAGATIHYGSKMDLLKYDTPWDAVIVENSTSQEYQIEMPFPFHHEKIAFIRSRIEGFHLILGSYLPSLFSFQKIRSGSLHHISNKNIECRQSHPKIIIRSMNQEIRKHGFHLIPFTLQEEMDRAFQSGKKIVLLLNRKGYANILLCQHCSSLVLCPKCESPMTLFSDKKTIRCKNCGYQSEFSPVCSQCGKSAIKLSSFGTEKLEEEARRRFPYMHTIRIDRNQVPPTEEDLEQSHLIIGTTLTLNRVCWDDIDFCCILGIDARMNYPVYHNQVDIFYLFSQLSEKLATSTEDRKKILVFSFTPMAEIFQWLTPSRFPLFFSSELKVRSELQYPPFTHLLEWRIQSKEVADLQAELNSLRSFFSNLPDNVVPTLSRIEKIREDMYACRIQFKTRNLWNLSPFFRVRIDELKKNEKIVLDVKKWEW